MKRKTLSVIIPAYNEEKTIDKVLEAVAKAEVSISKEVIIVNDGSTDSTKETVENFLKNSKYKKDIKFRLINKPNGGKGSAVKLGFKEATGDIVLIQDADLEYNPNEYQQLIEPILSGEHKVVYGSRQLNKKNKGYSTLSFYLGGLSVTLLTNLLYFSRLTDEPTCYKVFHSDVIKNIEIKGNKFEWEPEVTAKILKRGIKIHEVPISYFPRSFRDGKKINWRDGIQALWTLVKYRFKD